MRIAIVHDWLTGMRGGEKALEVICERFPDAELFTLVHVRGSVSPPIERLRRDLVRKGIARAGQFSWEQSVRRVRAIYGEVGA